METQRSLLATIREAVRGPGPGMRLSEERMPPLDGATGWLNTPPLTTEELRGHVVAVDFWTYTCINWLRTEPYLRAWADAYRSAGLVVLGVHTPEFAFEHDVANVRRAVADRRITHPVAIDSDYGIWTAFGNMYWPALYLVDAEGYVRHSQFGEGGYDESERVLRQLLGEAGTGARLPDPVAVEGDGIEAAADWVHLRSGENYLGAGRTEGFSSPEGGRTGATRGYTTPARLAANSWALDGRWTVLPDAVRLDEAGGRITYRFTARDLHLVVAPPPSGEAVAFALRLDGRPPGANAGDDVADDGTGTVSEPRLHQLLRQRGPVVERTVEIDFSAPGVQAYAVTFG